MVSIKEIECVHIKKNLVFGIQKLYTQFIKIPLLCDNLPIKLLYKLYKKSTFTSSAILHTTANHRAYGVCPKRGRSRSPTNVNSVCLFVCLLLFPGRQGSLVYGIPLASLTAYFCPSTWRAPVEANGSFAIVWSIAATLISNWKKKIKGKKSFKKM